VVFVRNEAFYTFGGMKYLIIVLLLASCGQSKQQQIEQAKIELRSAEESIQLNKEIRQQMVNYAVEGRKYPGKATPDSLHKWDSLAIDRKYHWQYVIDSLNTH
jgi:hypothetical protein